MKDEARLHLKNKYSLVHVPSVHKTSRWLDVYKTAVAAGDAPEQAGITAAREVFPYEFKERAVYSEISVAEILRLLNYNG
ncbi:MAG: hypothetical protein LC641_02815 [Spirochaeta sp.]|nr:hypothetical protein [Spirochaeta sp.]